MRAGELPVGVVEHRLQLQQQRGDDEVPARELDGRGEAGRRRRRARRPAAARAAAAARARRGARAAGRRTRTAARCPAAACASAGVSRPPCGILVVMSVPEGWSEVDGALEREFAFDDFRRRSRSSNASRARGGREPPPGHRDPLQARHAALVDAHRRRHHRPRPRARGAHRRARLIPSQASAASAASSTGAPARISPRAASTLPQIPRAGSRAACPRRRRRRRRPCGSAPSSAATRRRARVELADRLVAEVEQIGVEERQVVVGLPGAGHVRADRLTVRVRVILVLDPPSSPSADSGKRATSPAANTSSRPPARPYSSTTMPSSTAARPRPRARRRLDAEARRRPRRLRDAARPPGDLRHAAVRSTPATDVAGQHSTPCAR